MLGRRRRLEASLCLRSSNVLLSLSVHHREGGEKSLIFENHIQGELKLAFAPAAIISSYLEGVVESKFGPQ